MTNLTASTSLRKRVSRIVLVVRDHLGGVDAGERVLQRVLQQARRAHRQRRVHAVDQGAQVADELGRQLRALAGVGDAVVGSAAVDRVRQVVLVHEGVEDVGGQDHQPRHVDPDAGARGAVEAAEDVLRHEREAGRLAAELALPDARHGVVAVEEAAVERGHGVAGDHRHVVPLPVLRITASRGRGRPTPRG